MPHSELMTIIEYVFNGKVSIVHKAYWTRDVDAIKERKTSKEITLELFMHLGRKVDFNQEGTSIDVTEQVQHSFLNYFSIFGTKTVNFNIDQTPFNRLDDLIGPDAK